MSLVVIPQLSCEKYIFASYPRGFYCPTDTFFVSIERCRINRSVASLKCSGNSVFDIFATRTFLDQLAEHKHAGKMQVGIVGMRVDSRTIAADKLRAFVEGLGLPVLGYLRDTQNYIHLAARGLTVFDVAPSRVEKDLEQWQAICRWLDQ